MELQHLQRAACIMITGAMRTTPIKMMEMLLNLPTLSTVIEAATLTAAYRLPRPDKRPWKRDIAESGRLKNVDNKFTMKKTTQP